MKIDLEFIKGVLIIRLEGSLVRNTIYKINNYILVAIKKHKIKYLIYNLKNLKKIDSEGINVILKTKCMLRKNKGAIYLCEVSEKFKNLLKNLRIKILPDELPVNNYINVNKIRERRVDQKSEL